MPMAVMIIVLGILENDVAGFLADHHGERRTRRDS